MKPSLSWMVLLAVTCASIACHSGAERQAATLTQSEAPMVVQVDTPTAYPTDTPYPTPTSVPTPAEMTCERESLYTIGSTEVWRLGDNSAFIFEGGMTIDADGAPDAYHPTDDDLARDWLANAGVPGNWWALATDDDGELTIQGPDDPAPGFCVSMTVLQDESADPRSPSRYVDAASVPFIVLPYNQIGDAQLGDLATVYNRANGRVVQAIFADLGPPRFAGEGSVALAEALGVDSDARWGGTTEGIVYIVYPGSGNGAPRPVAEIESESQRLFEAWGGMRQLEACLGE